MARILPVDAHVHFHRRRWVAPALDAAANHFAKATNGRRVRGVLLLAQTRDENVFEWLHEQSSVGSWRVHRTAEPQTLRAERDSDLLLVVCGRQVRAEHGLEVLALGTTETFPENEPLNRTLKSVRTAGALPVLPWGFGKWFGRRGKRVQALLERSAPGDFLLGDNGGRLRLAPRPGLLRRGADRGFKILPGTDPFPFGRDFRRVGSFGCLARLDSSESLNWRTLRAHLADHDSPLQPYGRSTPLGRFGFNQLAIQLHVHLRRRSDP